MDIVIIQPPLVQLNTPYPSGAYLASFFRYLKQDKRYADKIGSVTWLDLSTELFHEIFSSKGLQELFSRSYKKALAAAQTAESNGDDQTAFQLRRYISQKPFWIQWIDRITALVCGGTDRMSGHEWCHEFVRSASVPRGNRMEQYLLSLGRDVSADDARILASLALADLADYISAAYDSNFELIRYAERIASSTASLDDILTALNAPVLTAFYKPLLERTLHPYTKKDQLLFCISVPFPGTVAAALYTAQYIRTMFAGKALSVIGGGYVNTELRNMSDIRFFDYADCISYDRGYGSFLALIDNNMMLTGNQLYKLKYAYHNKIIQPLDHVSCYEEAENKLTRCIFPDYTGISMQKSPRLADDFNPMHRLWSDGAWLKAYLAYGCYWHRCAFCDTSLEYVYHYCKTDVTKLQEWMRNQAHETGVYGIHFVDEACPPLALQEFAMANCRSTAPLQNSPKLTFWGNIRFEKTFSRDLADILAYGGLTGVSAGIEIATGKGLDSIHKGTDIGSIVSACAAFKEAGILTHGYMIYGFWNQTEQDMIDSLETLRQLFEAGLLDSAFFHKFTLTRHSTVFREWEQGIHPDLHPILDAKTETARFAENDIPFAGENKSSKYGRAVSTAVDNWMHGQGLQKNVQSWFPFKVPAPSVSKNYIQQQIGLYEQLRDRQFSELPQRNEQNSINSGKTELYVWLGGECISLSQKKKQQLCWSYMGELHYADVAHGTAAAVADALEKIRPETGTAAEGHQILELLGKKLFLSLRGNGLCRLL